MCCTVHPNRTVSVSEFSFYQTSPSFCFCFVLCNEPTFWQLTFVYSAFYRLYLKITFLFLVSRVRCQMLRFFGSYHHYYSEFQEFLFNTLRSRNFLVKSVGKEVDFWENALLKFLTRWIKHLSSQEVGGRDVFAGCILGERNFCCIL